MDRMLWRLMHGCYIAFWVWFGLQDLSFVPSAAVMILLWWALREEPGNAGKV